MSTDNHHRRLLIPEKPLFFWAFALGRTGWEGVRAWSRVVASVGRTEIKGAGEQGWLLVVIGLPVAFVVYGVATLLVAGVLFVLLLLVLVGFSVWVALLPLCAALSVPGIVAATAGSVWVIYRRCHGVTLRCKRGGCKFRDLQLAYRCPGCGQAYRELVPSYFGLLSHRCSCGRKLPALAALGREQKLTKVCPVCETVWCHGDEPLVERFVALVGGGSVGKTSYLTMAVQTLLDAGDGERVRWRFESRRDEFEHGERLAALSMGQRLAATQRGIPDALVLRLQRDGCRDERLYLYDASGEEYIGLEREAGAEMTFFQDVSGILLMVDPLELARPRLDASDRVPEDDPCGVSQIPLRVVVGTLCRNVRRFLRYGYGGLTEIPLAVVVTKADCPEVAGRIGPEVVGRDGSSEHEACRRALVEWGVGDQIVALERDFPTLRYFSCSALGRTPDGSGIPFAPRAVLPPLLWVLAARPAPGQSRTGRSRT